MLSCGSATYLKCVRPYICRFPRPKHLSWPWPGHNSICDFEVKVHLPLHFLPFTSVIIIIQRHQTTQCHHPQSFLAFALSKIAFLVLAKSDKQSHKQQATPASAPLVFTQAELWLIPFLLPFLPFSIHTNTNHLIFILSYCYTHKQATPFLQVPASAALDPLES
jgi:hypothetical protein